MRYSLEGHELRHAVEEMLLHLLPAASITLGKAGTGEDFCVSALIERGGVAFARAEVRLNGVDRVSEDRDTIEGLTPVARKRVETRLVKNSVYNAIVPLLEEPPVWGALTGVRPAKLARGLMERGMGRGDTAKHLREVYHVAPSRAALVIRAAATAMALDKTLSPDEISLYVGIPFCPSRCSYCSFVSSETARSQKLIKPFLDTLMSEIRGTGELVREAGKRIASVYIGGGTPTTLDEHQLKGLLGVLEDSFDFSGLREYTVEAGRPDTITPGKLRVMREYGVNRVSINPQTMDERVLETIGRRHTSADVLTAYARAREMGFQQINMDLIAGLPGDTVEGFSRTVSVLTRLRPENITVHTLAIKNGANLSDRAASLSARGTVGAMLALASDALHKAGYGPYYVYRQKFSAGGYENTGWCTPGNECFYNVVMMEELQSILSLGAGGVSKRIDRETGGLVRVSNPKYPLEYIEASKRLVQGKRRLFFDNPENDNLFMKVMLKVD